MMDDGANASSLNLFASVRMVCCHRNSFECWRGELAAANHRISCKRDPCLVACGAAVACSSTAVAVFVGTPVMSSSSCVAKANPNHPSCVTMNGVGASSSSFEGRGVVGLVVVG